jgi:hypothetical protein
MSVVSMVVGATTPSGATFVVKVDGGGPVRVAVADNEAMAGAVFTSSQAVDADGVAKVSITGLTADTRWWWQVEDNGVLDTSLTGRFRTHPPLGVPATFSFAIASCAGSNPQVPGIGDVLAADRISNHPVFTHIIDRDPLWFSHMGDLFYYDLGNGVVGDGSLSNYLRAYDDVLAQPNQHELYRSVAWQYVWDNHDWGRSPIDNESDGTLPDKANAQAAYRARVPHYPLSDPNGIWQAWQVGRVQFVALDTRSYRDPNSDPDGPTKSMLGAAQKTWLQGVLESSTAQYLVLISSSVWHNPPLGADTWESFSTERQELIDLFEATGWLQRMCIIWGDRHAMGIDSGSNMPGGMPGAQFAPLDDSSPSGGATWFDTGPEGSQPGQYGVVTIQDLGTALVVELAGWQNGTLWRAHRYGLSLQSPIETGSAQVVEFAEHVRGSHQPVFEARVLTSFQTGNDPAGVTIPIVGGDVQYDNTAEVFATLRLITAGVDEDDTGETRFPRLPNDLLAPYGNEIWVRRGIDLGGQILWSPLGYFRIDNVEQQDSPYGEISISGQDRMAGIVDARLVVPRTFPPDTTVAGVFATMVGEVYPDAVIVFDDDTGFAPIGNMVTFEEDRHEPLVGIAGSFGKVMYWDGEGVLRIESPPDESQPVMEVNAGSDGVLLTSSRRVSREGVYNAVIARGEGGEQTDPVLGVAVDIGPTSPTRWGGRFGKVPRYYSSPYITTVGQAEEAAAAILRRQLGAPFSVNFDAAPNPALRPWHVIRVTQRDGNREIHVVQTLTIPLTADGAMTGTTRERAQVIIGREIVS